MSFYVASAACGGMLGSLCAHGLMQNLFLFENRVIERRALDGDRIKEAAFGVMRAHYFGLGTGVVVGIGVALAITYVSPLAKVAISAVLIADGIVYTLNKTKEIFNSLF